MFNQMLETSKVLAQLAKDADDRCEKAAQSILG